MYLQNRLWQYRLHMQCLLHRWENELPYLTEYVYAYFWKISAKWKTADVAQMQSVRMIQKRLKLSALANQDIQTPALHRRSCAQVEQLNWILSQYLKRILLHSVLVDSCRVNNGGCGPNAVCSYDPKTNAPICTCKTGYINTGSKGNVVCTLTAGRCAANLHTAYTNVTSQNFKKGKCPASPDGHRYGWHFITPDISSLFVAVKCDFKKAGSVTKMIQTPSTQHAFVFTPTDDTLLSASAVIDGVSKTFSLEHVC